MVRVAVSVCALLVLASPRARAQPVAGRVDIISAPFGVAVAGPIDVISGRTRARILARFATAPLDDALGAAGACTLTRPARVAGVAAGALTIDGIATQPVVVEPMPAGGAAGVVYARELVSLPPQGSAFTVDIAGAGDVPHAVATVQMPAPIPDFAVAPTATDVVATWTPVPHAGDVDIVLFEHESGYDRGAAMVCRVADTGRFAIARSVLAAMPSAPAVLVPMRVARVDVVVGGASIAVRAVQVGASFGIQPPAPAPSRPKDPGETQWLVMPGVTLGLSNSGGVVGAEVSVLRWRSHPDRSCRGPLCLGAALGEMFTTSWLGVYADGVYDVSRDAARFTLGPEVGATVFGVDGGGVIEQRAGKTSVGVAIRPVITFGVLAGFVRYERVAGDNVVEGGVLLKWPLRP